MLDWIFWSGHKGAVKLIIWDAFFKESAIDDIQTIVNYEWDEESGSEQIHCQYFLPS